MAITDALHKRRSIYQLGKDIPVSIDQVKGLIEQVKAAE